MFFALPNFRGRVYPKNCTHLNTPASRHVAWKSFVTVLPKFADFPGWVVVDHLLFRFSMCGSFSEIFAIKVWSCMKLTQILDVLGPQFIWGRAPEFLDLHYKAQPDCDHVAKFHGDRPRELGGSPAKEKTSAIKHKAFRNYRSGRPNKFKTGKFYAYVDSYNRMHPT